MNWSKALQVLFTVSLAIGGATQALALNTTALKPHVQDCKVCHNAFGGASGSFNVTTVRHVCVHCHSPGGVGARMPFSEEAMANPFGSTPNVVPSNQGSWRSHNWDSPMVKVPAGAEMPVAPTNMNNASLNKFWNINQTEVLSCTRCHRVHGGYVDSVPDYDAARLLRDRNDKDQMCNNCHRSRVNQTAANGSHPVTINYTSAWRTAKNPDNSLKYTTFAQYTQSFYKTPRSANPANYSAKLSNYYIEGKINCSTCHSVHYGDSDSLTFDNRSTANSNQFNHSTGMLLRTDQFGATADAVNICTNCHKQNIGSRTRAHDNKATTNQAIQCGICHEAHLDISAGTVNKSLVARNIQYSSAKGSAKTKNVAYTAAAPYFKAPQNSGLVGICEACHRVPQPGEINPRTNISDYPDEHISPAGAVAANCNGCHPHNGTYGGFSYDPNSCKNCHGYPPPQAASSLINYTTNELNTPHRSHSGGIAVPNPDPTKYGYSCVECHYSGQLSPNHSNGVAQDLFLHAGPIGTKFGSTPVYNKANRTCDNVYCHSNGNPRDAVTPPIAYKTTPSWKNGAGAFNTNKCSRCHDDATTINTGAHNKHLTRAGATCQTCHADTANDNTTIRSRVIHVNGNKDLKMASGGSFLRGTHNSLPDVNCTNSCHTSGQAWWWDPASAACGTCHLTSPEISSYSPGTINSNAHTVHLTATTGPKVGTVIASCQVCHTYVPTVNHINGTVIVTTTKCFACHPTANGQAVWSSPASVSCRSCHVGTASFIQFSTSRKVNATAPLMNNYTTAGHGKSFGGVGSVTGALNVKVDCDRCHDNTTAHIATGSQSKRMTRPVNDVCFECHNQTWSYNSVLRTKLVTKTHVRFGESAANPTELCSACHDPHSSGNNKKMIRATIKFSPLSAAANIIFTNPTSGFVRADNRGLCQVCHTKTNHFRRNRVEVGDHTTADKRKCLQCHKHQPEDLAMAFIPSGGCDSCHGYPPAKVMTGLGVHNNYSSAKLQTALATYGGTVAGGGAHTVPGHVGKDTTKDNHTNSNCTNCHSQYPEGHMTGGGTVVRTNIQLVIDPKFKFNKDLPVQYDRNGTRTCSNVSCHYAPTPSW